MQIADSLDATLGRARETAGAFAGTAADPVFWLDLVARGVRVMIVVLMATVVLSAVRSAKRRWVRRASADAAHPKRRQRVQTVADLLGSVSRYVVWTVATITALSEFGLDVGPLLAGAGIAGLAVGFGAQTLVRDVISGVFLLFDNTLGYGDLISFNGQTGTVEYVGLRIIKVRKFDGELLMVPAGELRTFGNKSIGFARAIVEVGLPYEADLNEALGELEAVAARWAESEHAKAVMIDEAPQVQSVMALADSAVTARIVVQVRPGEQFEAERDLRRMVKEGFDARGLEIPFPRQTLYLRPEASPEAPAAPAEASAPSAAGQVQASEGPGPSNEGPAQGPRPPAEGAP